MLSSPVHSPDVSHIILSLADTLEELVLSSVILGMLSGSRVQLIKLYTETSRNLS